jgi:hypothetical protein
MSAIYISFSAVYGSATVAIIVRTNLTTKAGLFAPGQGAQTGGIVVTRATVMGEPALPRARAVNIFISGEAWQLELRGWSSSVLVSLSLGARINIFKLI